MVDLTKPVAVMCFSSSAGGMEISAVNLANLLSSVTKVVLVGKRHSFVERLYQEKGAGCNYESVSFKSRTFSLSMLFKVRNIIKKYGIGNVIFLGASELKTLYFSFIGLSVNLIVLHGTTKTRPKMDYIHRLVYSEVNYHVAVSEYLLGNVKSIVPGGKLTKYKVIHLSHKFKEAHLDADSKHIDVINIIHVGRVVRGKGQVDAVMACSKLRDAGFKFKLMLLGSGDGSDYILDVKNAISVAGLDDSVCLVGHVNDVESYLAVSDVMLFPSRGEGLSLAFIEALHYNIICIAYNNTVFPEYQSLGFYVHLVEDGNIAALSEKLLDATNNLSREKHKSLRNVMLSRKYFNVEREVKEWLEILV